MICGDVIVVKAKINGFGHLCHDGYFLISVEDEELLRHSKFNIDMRIYGRNFGISVKTTNSAYLFKTLVTETYPFKDKMTRHYVYKNNNPLDLRRTNLEESINSKKKITNKSGKTGVCFDDTNNRWVATSRINGKKVYASFSTVKYGSAAKKMAYEIRDKWEGK